MKLKILLLTLFIALSEQATSDDASYSFIQIDKSKLTGVLSRALSNENLQLTCIGDKIDFLDQPFSFFFDKAWNSESYWEKIDIKDRELKVPGFGLYRETSNLNRKRYWVLEDGIGWAKLDLDSGYFVATIGLIQLQARCLKKIKNWNNFQKQ